MKELIIVERIRTDQRFIEDTVQRGKLKPKKFKHYIEMPLDLFKEMTEAGIINCEDYYIEQSAWFEFRMNKVIISFICLYQCEDLHRKIDHYLIIHYMGYYPLKRGGIFF